MSACSRVGGNMSVKAILVKPQMEMKNSLPGTEGTWQRNWLNSVQGFVEGGAFVRKSGM